MTAARRNDETGFRTHVDMDHQIETEPGKAEQKALFVDLRAKGHSLSKIAKRLGVAKQTACNWNTELEEEIATLKAFELEALQERYYLLKEARIKLLGEQLGRINKEILSRPLDGVDTSKLLDLQLKYYAELKAEFVDPKPLSEVEQAELKALR